MTIIVLVNEGDDWGDKTEGWWRLADVDVDSPEEAVRQRFEGYGSKPRHSDTAHFIAATCGPGHPWQEWKVTRRFWSATESIVPFEDRSAQEGDSNLSPSEFMQSEADSIDAAEEAG